MYGIDSSSCAVPFIPTEGCALKGSLFALITAPHIPFLIELARKLLFAPARQNLTAAVSCLS